jgi:hypothetical protein
MNLGPNGDTSVGLEPVEELSDPGEASGAARLAAQRGDERSNTDLGGETVGLGDDQGAAGIAVAGGNGTAIRVDAQSVGVDGSVIIGTLSIGNDVEVDELQVRVDGKGICVPKKSRNIMLKICSFHDN